jgi:hypothetical protein
MNEQQIDGIIRDCLRRVANEQPPLDLTSIRENVVAFRLGIAFESRNEFREYKIDSEYNRDVAANDLKRRLSGGTIRPDLIVHKRTGNNQDNLLAVEIKWNNSQPSAIQDDREKLADIKQKYGYPFCILLILPRVLNNFADDAVIEFIS